MRTDPLTKNRKVGYSLAVVCLVIAIGLLLAGWKAIGAGFGTFAVLHATGLASAHGHLSKRGGDDKKVL